MSLHPAPRVAVVLVAAGSGTRLGEGAPKAFVGLDEHTILRHALRGVFAAPGTPRARPSGGARATPEASLAGAQVVIVVPAGHEGEALTEAREAAGERSQLVSVVTGGATRQASVAAGLAALWPAVEVVLVHDAARALTPPEVFARVIDAVDRTGWGVVPALPVIDTLKRVDGDRIVEAVDRAQLAAAQTPQGFRRDVLETSYAVASQEYTDDAALVAAAGHCVAIVDGHPHAFKITTPADLERARAIAAPVAPVPSGLSPRPAGPRVGIGTDAHAFGGDGALWLAGLEWPGELALSGHSDGDAVAHAMVDALLSAAGLGDIGTHFGTARPEFAGAHADAFLARTRALLGEAGWTVVNVAVQIQSNRPTLAPRRAEAEAALSAALGGAPVSLSATTTDGLGFAGAGEGVQAFAVALIQPA